MATKSYSKKTSTKKGTTKKGSTKKRKGNLKVTPTSAVFTLNATQKRQAEQCLKETGRITLSVREIATTKLNELTTAVFAVN
jgi:hypothetical protein